MHEVLLIGVKVKEPRGRGWWRQFAVVSRDMAGQVRWAEDASLPQASSAYS